MILLVQVIILQFKFAKSTQQNIQNDYINVILTQQTCFLR